MAEVIIPDPVKEKYYYRRGADHEYTAPNLPKIARDVGRGIDSLNTIAQGLDEVLNGNLPPPQRLARVQQASDVLTTQLSRLQQIFELLEWSVGESSD